MNMKVLIKLIAHPFRMMTLNLINLLLDRQQQIRFIRIFLKKQDGFPFCFYSIHLPLPYMQKQAT